MGDSKSPLPLPFPWPNAEAAIDATTDFVREVGRIGYFTARTARKLPSAFAQPGRVAEDAFEIAFGALPSVMIVSLFVGTELALQGYHAFKEFGAQNMVGVFVALAGVREMAPILATGMIAAKAGAAITTNLAVMRNTQQLDAMEVMAVDPIEYLVAPKFIAALIALPALTIIADVTALFSAYLLSVTRLQIEGAYFWANVIDYLTPFDFFIGLLKSATMGVVIWVLSCYFGYTAAPGPEGVGRAANSAIVAEVIVAISVALVVSAVAYRV